MEEEQGRIRKTALGILAICEQTEKGMREKLSQKGFSPEQIDPCIDWLLSHRYLDERRFLESELRRLAEKKKLGPMRFREELRKKGFREELIADRELQAACLADVDFFALAKDYAEAQLRRHPLPPPPAPSADSPTRTAAYAARRKAEARLYAALARRGYPAAIARETLQQLREET